MTIEKFKRNRELANQLKQQATAKVEKWIQATFENVTSTPQNMPGLPGATLIEDQKGESMLVWYDIFTDSVKWI